jgi:hypothetical protein
MQDYMASLTTTVATPFSGLKYSYHEAPGLCCEKLHSILAAIYIYYQKS